MLTERQELIYKTIGERKLELSFLPPLKRIFHRAPLYLVVPGGGWHGETRQSMLDFSQESIAALRERGFAVASIDYRVVSKDRVIMPGIITDCFDAARFLACHAQELEIDPERFAVSGHSAGGHLALMLAYGDQNRYRDENSLDVTFRVTCAAVMSPATVLHHLGYHNLRDITDVFVGEDLAAGLVEASPCRLVDPNCPPTFTAAGTADPLIYSNSSELLCKLLREQGVPGELMLVRDGGHCFERLGDGPVPDRTMTEVQQKITDFILNYA